MLCQEVSRGNLLDFSECIFNSTLWARCESNGWKDRPTVISKSEPANRDLCALEPSFDPMALLGDDARLLLL